MSYNQATLGTCPRSSGDRASASGAESHRFESCRGHHTFTRCAHTHVLSCIYHSLYSIYSFPCCVFTLFCIASSILCAAYLIFSEQHLLSPFMSKKYVLHVSQHTAHIILIMVCLTGSNAIYGVLLAATLYSHQHTNSPYAQETAFDQHCLALALTCPLKQQMHRHFDTLP